MFDPIYLVITLPALLLSLGAQWLVKSRVKAMHGMQNQAGLTGRQTAERILKANGITDVRVEGVSGWLSDHYSPSQKVLRLSPEIHDGRTVSALAVAAHEVGHAIQHHRAYAPLALRSTLAPVASVGSNIAMWIVAFGVVFASMGISMAFVMKIACILFTAFVLFTLITLPVEFDASRRAMQQLEALQMTGGTEYVAARKVLTAAAMTYVAAAASAVVQLIYFAYRAGLLGNRR